MKDVKIDLLIGKFTIESSNGGYTLLCNNNFVFWNTDLKQVYVALGKHLEGITPVDILTNVMN